MHYYVSIIMLFLDDRVSVFRPDIGDTETIITTTAPTVSEVVPISETVLVQDTADDMCELTFSLLGHVHRHFAGKFAIFLRFFQVRIS